MKCREFCSKKGLTLTNTDLIKLITDRYFYFTSYKIFGQFYNVQSNENIKKSDTQLISHNTFGKRIMLFLTRINEINYCLIIIPDKKEIVNIRLRFDNCVFETTIIEGEIHKDLIGDYRLACNDILYSCGKNIMCMPLEKRIKELIKVLKNHYEYDEMMNPFKIYTKKYYEYNEENINKILKMSESYDCDYNINGIIIKNKLKYEKYNIIIYPIEKRTFNNKILIIHKTPQPDIYELYVRFGVDGLESMGMAYIYDTNHSHFVKGWFTNKNYLICECEFNDFSNRWKPIKLLKNASLSSI